MNAVLKEEGRGDLGGRRPWLRQSLVVGEVALALVLLVGAGLLIRSFSRLLDVEPGYQTRGVLSFQVAWRGGKAPARKVQFVGEVVERLKALPGVEGAAATDSLPLTDFERIAVAEIEGRPPIDVRRLKRGEVKPISRPTVTPGYFEAMGIPVRSGRTFAPPDARFPAVVVMVNEAFERIHFPGDTAVGRRIRVLGPGEPGWQTVVGVVRDVRQSGLASDVLPEVYSPALEDAGDALSFVLRVSGPTAGVLPAVRAAVAGIDPNQPLHNLMTMEERLALTTTPRRLNTTLLGVFAGVALLLAVVGIYGVMSYAVAQRRREIAVRMALGARRRDALGLVIGGGLRLTLLGVALGLVGAFVLTRTLSSQLYAVKATDPVTFLGVAAVLTGVALLASWLPARRAARIDPMEAMRSR